MTQRSLFGVAAQRDHNKFRQIVRVFLAFRCGVRVVSHLELYPERRSLKLKGLGKKMFQIADIALWNVGQGCAVDNNDGRIVAALMCITELGASATGSRRLLALD